MSGHPQLLQLSPQRYVTSLDFLDRQRGAVGLSFARVEEVLIRWLRYSPIKPRG